MTETIVVLDPIGAATADRLRALLPPGMAFAHASAREEAHLQSLIADADYAVSGQVAVTGAVLRAGCRLRLLHKWSVGVDNSISTRRGRSASRSRGRPGAMRCRLREFTLGLVIACMRRFAAGHAALAHTHDRAVGPAW